MSTTTTAAHPDTIAAIATAAGRGAVGIVRVSGHGLAVIAQGIAGRLPRPRAATYLPFLAADGTAIDQGLCIHFPAPHSYTGEDVLEFQAHGGPVVLQLLLARCLELAGPRARLARPGEFSERAFLNGKIDLLQAEAIADLIDASTEAAARSASRAIAGDNATELHTVRDALIHLRMLVEATLDFPEEEIDDSWNRDAHIKLSNLEHKVERLVARSTQGAILRDGLRVVIAGQPNVGKSSLLNALAGAELAIVTPIAGTTRDRIEQSIQIEGVAIHVVDTAGLRHSADEVERIGIARAWDEIGRADAILFVHDLVRATDPSYAAADLHIHAELSRSGTATVPVVHIWNKADAARPPWPAQALQDGALRLSAKDRQGLEALRQRLLALAGWQGGAESVLFARARHVQAFQRVAGHLRSAAPHLAGQEGALDLAAEELRLAQNALNSITGEFGADDLLGVIFSSFCIGK